MWDTQKNNSDSSLLFEWNDFGVHCLNLIALQWHLFFWVFFFILPFLTEDYSAKSGGSCNDCRDLFEVCYWKVVGYYFFSTFYSFETPKRPFSDWTRVNPIFLSLEYNAIFSLNGVIRSVLDEWAVSRHFVPRWWILCKTSMHGHRRKAWNIAFDGKWDEMCEFKNEIGR